MSAHQSILWVLVWYQAKELALLIIGIIEIMKTETFKMKKDRILLDHGSGGKISHSLTTDIKGAVAAGYDSLWVTRGIYAAELGIAPGDQPDPDKVHEVCERHGHWPTAAIASFDW